MIKFYGKNDLASDFTGVHQSTKFFTVAFLNNHFFISWPFLKMASSYNNNNNIINSKSACV